MWVRGEAMKRFWVVLSIVMVVGAVVAYHYLPVSSKPSQPGANAYVTPSQQAVPQAPTQAQVNAGFPFQDTSILKPPVGAKVAVFEFEDLECPACAHAYPLVRAALDRYHIPLVRRDYPWSFHVWSFDAAVTARYIEDNLSPRLAEMFRGDVFLNQARIASKDDLTAFTRAWFQSHGRAMPFVMDASGACRNEVESDRALGNRLGVHSTPCIIVVTEKKWIPVADVRQLDRVIEMAFAQTAAAAESSSTDEEQAAAVRTALPRLVRARS
jgi:protein-disulfide isomerase